MPIPVDETIALGICIIYSIWINHIFLKWCHFAPFVHLIWKLYHTCHKSIRRRKVPNLRIFFIFFFIFSITFSFPFSKFLQDITIMSKTLWGCISWKNHEDKYKNTPLHNIPFPFFVLILFVVFVAVIFIATNIGSRIYISY